MTSVSEPETDRSEAAEAKRRREVEKLLGDVIPDLAADDTDDGWNEPDRASRDDELRRDVPPHHG